MSDENEEEGFVKQEISIFLQEPKYQSYFYPPQHKPLEQTASMFQQEQQLSEVWKVSKLIDKNLREQQLKQIYNLYKEKIIFCNIKSNKYPVRKNRTITFSSMFQSGNLDLVIEAKTHEYHLFLRPDSNTDRPCQWYNFKCKCQLFRFPITFKICNLKQYLLYEQGLRPYIKKVNKGWQQIQSQIKCLETIHGFSLTFTYEFQNNEVVQFAGSPVYAVTDLTNLLAKIQIFKNVKIKTLCNSALKIPINYIQIGACQDFKSTVGLAISRQHPGQTSGSYVAQGFINKIIERSQLNIMWIIVPMVNIDGVYIGNNRSNLAGYDLNRKFNAEDDANINKQKQKALIEVYAVLKLVKQMKSRFGKRFRMFLDFHGHSTMPCSFSYGPQIILNDSSLNSLEVRLYPQLIATKNQHFKTDLCSYNIKKYKQNAARSIVLKKYRIPYSYTIQTSYGLGNNNKKLNTQDFIEIGQSAAEASIDFMKYLIFKQQASSSIQKQNSLITNCKSLMDKIKININQNKIGNLLEIDSSDNESQKGKNKSMLLKTKIKIKINNPKKLDAQNFKVRRSTQTNNNNKQEKLPNSCLIQQLTQLALPIKALNCEIAKRVSTRQSIYKNSKYDTIIMKSKCFQKVKANNIRIKKLSGSIPTKQVRSKSVYNTRQIQRKEDNPVFVFY